MREIVLPISCCAVVYESGGGVGVVCSALVFAECVVWLCGGEVGCVGVCVGQGEVFGSLVGG